MMETASERRDRIRREAQELAFGPQVKSEKPAAAPAPAPSRGVRKALADALISPDPNKQGIIDATVSGVKAGGQHIANAIVPPTGDPGLISRAGEAGYGILRSLMAVAGVDAGSSAGRQLLEGVVGDKEAPLPPEASRVFRTAQFLFSIPEYLSSEKRAQALTTDPKTGNPVPRPEHLKELADNFNKPATWGELGEFFGAFGGAKAVHAATSKMGGGKAAPKTETPQAKRAAAAAEAEAKLKAVREPEPVTGPREPGEAPIQPEAERFAPAPREAEALGENAFADSGNSPPGHEPGVGVTSSEPMAAHDAAMAAEYDAAQTDPAAKPAWDALAADTEKKFNDISKKVNVEKVTGQPYASAAEMNADIAKGNFKVTTDNSEHPFWNEDQNWKFRVVHDYLGHFLHDNDFSLKGETKAFHKHAAQVEDAAAKKALQIEIYGQAAANVAHGGEFQPQKAYLSEQPMPPDPGDYSAALHAATTEGSGATFDPRTGEAAVPANKFVVSNTKGGAMVTPTGEFTPEKIAEFRAQHADELAEPDAYHGTWNNEGNVYQDVSRRVDTADQAHEIGRKAGQKAFWDEANNAEVPVQTADPYLQNALPPDETNPSAAETLATAPGAIAGEGALEQVRQNEQTLADAGQPVAEPVGAAPGAEPVAAEGGAPQVQSLTDAAQAVEPAVQAYGPPTANEYLILRDQANQLAQQMRAQGFSRRQVQDAYRQHLNDNGILSQSQSARIAKRAMESGETEPVPTPSSAELQPEHVNEPGVREELAKLKDAYAQLHDSVNKLLGINPDTVGGGVPLRGDISQLAETGKAAQVVLNQMAHVGAAIYLQGAKTFKAWAAEMRKEFGEISDEVLKKLFPKSKAALETMQDEYPQLLTPKGAQAAFTRGKKGLLWYDKAPEELARQYGPENANMAADVYAATSINTDASSTNITIADRAIKMILSGERDGFDKPFTRADNLHQQIVLDKLNAIARGEPLTGPKIGPYANTLKLNPTGTDVQGNRVFVPVLDSWMGRGFKFAGPDERWSPTAPQREYINKIINDIANAEGVQPYQVQSAMWTTFKREGEIARVWKDALIPRDEDFPFGANAGGRFRPDWDRARVQAAINKINNEVGTPFDELLQNRLGSAIQAAVATGDTSPEAGTRFLSAKVSKALMEPGALEDPVGTAQTALQSAGFPQDVASGLVPKILQAVKDRLNSTDPEGASLSQASMGFNPFDIWRLFHKDPDLASVPFDRDTTVAGLEKVKEAVPTADEALRADLRKPVTAEISKTVADARDSALKTLRAVMDKDVWEPGDLHHAVTVAAALAEKARNAEIREKSLSGKRGPVAVKPINDESLLRFAESVHEMSEPELYGKLRALDKDGQQRWLANMFRASDHPSHFSAEGLQKLYHGLYYNEALSSVRTLAKSVAVHTSVFPWVLAQEGIATQIGRFTENAKRAVPGQMGQLWAGLSEGLMQHWKGIASGDIEGLKMVMEQEGDLHLMGSAHPETMLDNILNIGSAPSAALGSVRSPIKNSLRRGALFAESFRRVTEEARSDETLLDQSKFQQRLEELRREPDEDLLKYANDFADKWSLTKKYNDLRGTVQANGKLDTTGMLLLDPFASVGVNAMSLATEMNPVTSLLSPEFRSALREGGAARDRALAGLALGAGILATGMAMQQQGWVDGPGPTDSHAHAMWEAAGHSANTVRNPLTGKPAFETKYLGIFGPLITSGAAMAQVWDGLDDHSRQQSIFALGHAIASTVTSAGILDTYAHIVTSIASGISDNGAALMDYLRDKLEAGLLVFPGHVGVLRDINALASSGTPQRESKYDNKDLVSQQWELIEQEFTAGLPGWEQGQPQIRNPIDGKQVPRLGLMGARDIDPSKVAAEIDRLHSAQQGLKFDIVKPKRSIGGSVSSHTGPGADASAYDPIPLSNWQYDRKLQIAAETTLGGKTLEERLTDMIGSSRYQAHAELEDKSPTARREGWCAARLREIYHDYETRGEQLLLKEDKHLAWEVAKSQYEAQQLQSLRPHPFPQPEPEPTKYPLPGQNTRK